MTKLMKDYLASRPAASGPVGTGDKVLILQDGVVKMAEPGTTAVLADLNGSGKRCQVSAVYGGKADDGVTDIWILNGATV